MAVAAELVGVPRQLVPASVAELEQLCRVGSPRSGLTPAATESMAYLLDPPGLDEDVAEIWKESAPPRSACSRGGRRQMSGYERHGP